MVLIRYAMGGKFGAGGLGVEPSAGLRCQEGGLWHDDEKLFL